MNWADHTPPIISPAQAGLFSVDTSTAAAVATVQVKGMLYAASVLTIVDIVAVQRGADFAVPQYINFDLARSFAAIAAASIFCRVHDTSSLFASLGRTQTGGEIPGQRLVIRSEAAPALAANIAVNEQSYSADNAGEFSPLMGDLLEFSMLNRAHTSECS